MACTIGQIFRPHAKKGHRPAGKLLMLTDSAGHTGFGKVPGGETIRETQGR